jgi:hypothetical protein
LKNKITRQLNFLLTRVGVYFAAGAAKKMDTFFLEHVLLAEQEERATLKRQRDENHEELAAANCRIGGLVQATEGIVLIGTALQQLVDGKVKCEQLNEQLKRENGELLQQLAIVLKTARENAEKEAKYATNQNNIKRKKELDDAHTAILYLLRGQPVDSSVDKVTAGIVSHLERVRSILDN